MIKYHYAQRYISLLYMSHINVKAVTLLSLAIIKKKKTLCEYPFTVFKTFTYFLI